MRRLISVSLSLVVTLGSFGALAADPTEKPVEEGGPTTGAPATAGWQAMGLFGGGFNSSNIEGDGGNQLPESVGLYGLGVGARVGYTLPSRIYAGATFVYHFGQSKDANGVKYEGGALYPGVEAGYDLSFSNFVVRPYAGAGLVSVKLKASAGPSEIDASGSKLGFWPGVTLLYPIEKYFIGADARYVVVTGVDHGGSANAFSMFATAGVHL